MEYEFGATWVQMVSVPTGSPGWVLCYGVESVDTERERLTRLGVHVGDVETIPGVISFLEFFDPDGNKLSCYRVLAT